MEMILYPPKPNVQDRRRIPIALPPIIRYKWLKAGGILLGFVREAGSPGLRNKIIEIMK